MLWLKPEALQGFTGSRVLELNLRVNGPKGFRLYGFKGLRV